MDTALILKKRFDNNEIKNFKQAKPYIDKSELIKKLLTDIDSEILNLLNRLIELSEIPFTKKIEQVQQMVNTLADLSFCGDGFSLTGKRNDILACYNSMITSVLIRMGYSNTERISKGIMWILNYQNVERGLPNKWSGTRIVKYGGCMKLTPCYIGVVKAMIALSDYSKQKGCKQTNLINRKLVKGLNYILAHDLYKRQSNGYPITKDIDKITYPFSYKTNILEILRLLKENKLDSDPRCAPAKEFIRSKKRKTGFWQVNSTHLPKSWVRFDKPQEEGKWVTYEIEKLLNG